MCGVCVKLANSSLGDRDDILMILIIIIKSEVSSFTIVVMFFRGCVPEVAVPHMLSVWYICIPGNLFFFCPLILCSLMMCANTRVHYDPMVEFICLYITLPPYHHYTDLSESIELLKCLAGTFCLECLSNIKSIISIIFHASFIILLSPSNRKNDPFTIV